MVTCTELCQRALTCLAEGVERGGDSAIRVEADEARLMASCTSSCGGIWEAALAHETCQLDRTCGEMAGCFPAPPNPPHAVAVDGAVALDGEVPTFFAWHPESQCVGQAVGLEGCTGLP